MIACIVARAVKGQTAIVDLMHSQGKTAQHLFTQRIGKQRKGSQGETAKEHVSCSVKGKPQAQTSCSVSCSAEQVNWRCCSRALHSANDLSSAPALRDHTTPSLERSSCNTFWAMRSIQPAMSSQPLSHCCRLVKNYSTIPAMLQPLEDDYDIHLVDEDKHD